MKKLSLEWKIMMLGMVPLAAFLFFAGWIVKKSYNEYAETKIVHEHLYLVHTTSDLVDKTQVWRGVSAGFLAGSKPADVQVKQYNNVSAELNNVIEHLDESGFDEKYLEELKQVLDLYPEIQEKITKKQITPPDAIKQITFIVDRLLKIAVDTAEDSVHFAQIASDLRSLAMIEYAKENGGKFRATLTTILAKNKPMSETQLKKVLKLKAKVESNLQAKGLTLTKKEADLINQFLSSSSWASVHETFRHVLRRSEEGNYYRDPTVFFATISEALNMVKKVVKAKHNSLEDELTEAQNHAFVYLIGISLFSLIFASLIFVMTIHTVRKISAQLQSIAQRLQTGSNELSTASAQIADSSHRLSEASIEQASSLQETVSSADEINAMVNKNAASAKSSKEMSNKSEQSVNKAQKTVKAMLESIENISQSNDNVVSQMNEGNQKISEIVKVIREIGEKTDVINDIVFQTKLLSFNASVEAARAGEHGKGFAVVAEEVGNLASMSGNAANEISSMLNESIKKVEDIVEDTKSRVDRITSASTKTVDEGKQVAGECRQSLEQIMDQVTSVNQIVSEISEASSEQAQGVHEITSAMGQLDQVTQANTNIAQQSSNYANNLNKEAQSVDNIVGELLTLIHGYNKRIESANAENKKQDTDNVISFSAKENKETPKPTVAKTEKVAVGQSGPPEWTDDDFEDL